MKKGSVLMEFLVVFPIYLVLWAGVFMLGDMLVKSTRLASADRVLAFDVQNAPARGWNWILTSLFNPVQDVTDMKTKSDDLKKDKTSEFYADTKVSGPFSLRSAATVRDDYAIPGGGTRGQLAFGNWLLGQEQSSWKVDGDVATLFGGGRMKMHSKPSELASREYMYNYYTLKRVKYASGQSTWRAYKRCPRDIVNAQWSDARWYNEVYGEGWHQSINDDNNTKNNPLGLGMNVEYKRFQAFVTWSD